MTADLVVVDSREDLARAAAGLIADAMCAAIAANGHARVALSGGNTVRPIYDRVAGADGVDWRHVLLLPGDERYLPADNPLSNTRLIREAFAAQLAGADGARLLPPPVDAATPADGARAWEAAVRKAFGAARATPVLDLAVNGMGRDGHTASLYPRARHPIHRVAVAAHAGLEPWVDRVTLTMPVFQAARRVIVVVAGEEKRAVLHAVLEGRYDPLNHPVQALVRGSGEVTFIATRDAAPEKWENGKVVK